MEVTEIEKVKTRLKSKFGFIDGVSSQSEDGYVLVGSKMAGVDGPTVQYSLFGVGEEGLIDEWVEPYKG